MHGIYVVLLTLPKINERRFIYQDWFFIHTLFVFSTGVFLLIVPLSESGNMHDCGTIY